MKILILAANPRNTDRLRLDLEVRDIEEGLTRSQQRDRFQMVQRWAVSFGDVQRAILELNPQIVHFSGHGTGESGLVLDDGQGQAQLVSTEALAGLFALFADQVQCVLLNACYSEIQGQAIAQHIPYVIGMKQAIGDTAARIFSIGFYDALGAGRDIEFAYKLGCNRIQMASIAEHLTPVFLRGKATPSAPGVTRENIPDFPPVEPQDTPEPYSNYPCFTFEVMTIGRGGRVVDRKQSKAPYQTVDLGKGVTLDMVLIPGGTFIMGSPEDEPGKYSGSFGQYNERPQHEVTIAPFWMGRYPITVAQWRAVSTLPPVEKELDPYPFYISPDPVIFPRDALFGYFKVDDFPVERVTWDDAIEFCYRLSAHTGHTYTLPSEAQWEYACRAGTTTPFYFGKHITPQWANYNDSADPQYYRERTTPVGMFGIANPFGLYDMHGNVWERCLDHYWYSNYKGAPTDGSAWVVTGADKELPRILRGGSWYSFPGECRCASRHCDKSILLQSTHAGVGFRVVSIPSRL